MLLKLARLSSLLLALAVALENPSSRLEERLARRNKARQTNDYLASREAAQALKAVSGGIAFIKAEGTFTSVSGTFVVPDVSGNNGTFAVAWVGIDGFGCGSSYLQTGVDFTVNNEAPGGQWYTAWNEGYPGGPSDYPNMEIYSGQIIRLNVTVESASLAFTTIENLTSGQAKEVLFYLSSALCLSSVEWVVQDVTLDQSDTYANFGAMTFTDAIAVGPNGAYTPCDSTGIHLEVTDTQKNGLLNTNVDNDCNIIVNYV